MRTIDPFLAPGLWGGAPMPPQSPVTAGGLPNVPAGPPGGTKVSSAVTVQTIGIGLSQGPLASLAGSVLGPRFHAWYGRSRKRTICSVYPVRQDEAGCGLPDFTQGIVVAAARDLDRLYAVSVFALNSGVERQPRVDAAVLAGAAEWHVHLLAEDEKERRAVLKDFGGEALLRRRL